MDLGAVRRHHLSLVLESLLHEGPGSRSDLAKRIGLTKATMSALVADLLNRGRAKELDLVAEGRVGRPAAAIAPAGWSVGALGLEIGTDGVSACVVDLAGDVRIRRSRGGDNRRSRPGKVLDRVRTVARLALEEAAAAGVHCAGAGLAVPGLVDPATRALFVAPNLHWLDVDLTALDDDLGFEVRVDNEANLGALAELRHGAARGLQSFVFVSAGVGVGGAVVLDGSVVRGVHGFAGELGHVAVDPAGPTCACGTRGCLEAVIGADASAGHELLAGALATALRSVVHLVDPQAIVLGSALAEHDRLPEVLGEQLRTNTLGGRWRPCEVRRSTLGPDAAAIGAATTVLDTVLADPTLVPLNRSAP
jgi:predicted NBD/HSP70 family sugar kinase